MSRIVPASMNCRVMLISWDEGSSVPEGWLWTRITDAARFPATAKNALLSVNWGWTTLIGLDAGEQVFEVGIVNGGSGTNADTRSVYPGRGYWLYMTEPGNLCAIGM